MEAEEADNHDEKHGNRQEPNHKQDAGFEDRDALQAFGEEYTKLRTLENQKPQEYHTVVLAYAAAQPGTMVVMSTDTTATIAAVLCPERLVQVTHLAPAKLLTTLSRAIATAHALATIVLATWASSTFLYASGINGSKAWRGYQAMLFSTADLEFNIRHEPHRPFSSSGNTDNGRIGDAHWGRQ